MKNIISAILATLTITTAGVAIAEPLKDDEYYSNHSMGCMLLGECTQGVEKITSLLDVSSEYPNPEKFT